DPGVPTEEDVKRREEAKRKREERKKKKKIEEEQARAGERQHQQEATSSQTNDDETPPTPATTTVHRPQSSGAPKKIETKPRGEEAYTRRSKDGTWTKKNERSFFGYKLHTKADLSTGFVSDFDVTTASVHDENVDLTKKGEPCVRDRGYTNGGGRGLCITMIRAQAGKSLT